jgi:hypothetical protein
MRRAFLFGLLGLAACQSRVATLSEAWARETAGGMRRYKVVRLDEGRLRMLCWGRWYDLTVFDFDWPLSAGVVLDGWRLCTEDGSDPRILREKYYFNGR